MEELEQEKVETPVESLPFKEPVESSLMAQSNVVNNITNNNITNNIIITNSNNVVSVDDAKEQHLAVKRAKRGAAIAAFTAAATIGIATLFAPKETSAPEPDPVRIETEHTKVTFTDDDLEEAKEEYRENYNKVHSDIQMVSSNDEAIELAGKKEKELQSTLDKVFNDVSVDGKLDNPVTTDNEMEQAAVNKAISSGMQVFEMTQQTEEGRSR